MTVNDVLLNAIFGKKSAGACTTYRPDPETGEMVAVTAPAPTKRVAAIREGEKFGLWCDLTQAWEATSLTLDEAAQALCDYNGAGHPFVMFCNAGSPGNLTGAEIARLRALIVVHARSQEE